MQKEITLNIGRFGPYLKYDNKFYSLKGSEYSPLTISLQEAKIHIENKIKQEKDRLISYFDGEPAFYILNGRYGPFIQIGEGSRKNKTNIKIPKDLDPKSLTRKICLDLAEKSKKK